MGFMIKKRKKVGKYNKPKEENRKKLEIFLKKQLNGNRGNK